MASLPELTHREIVRLLRHAGCSIDDPDAPRLKGRTAGGKPFSIHIHSSQRARPETVRDILGRLGLSREEFWDLYRKRRL